jgi:hypothetical protein
MATVAEKFNDGAKSNEHDTFTLKPSEHISLYATI